MRHKSLYLSGLLAVVGLLHTPLYATVTILSMTPSHASPQPIGTTVTWTVTATDTNPGPLTFQFSTAYGTNAFSMVLDFNTGTLASGIWTSRTFAWTTIAGEGAYQVQVVAKDFTSGEAATQTASFQLTRLAAAGHAAVRGTKNPLVALLSAPSCAAGSSMRASFAASGGTPTYATWNSCNPPVSTNFYVAGMLPSTTYSIGYQVLTGSKITTAPVSLSFTTRALPTQIGFPSFTVVTPPGPQTDTTDSTLLHSITITKTGGAMAAKGQFEMPVATDLSGNITWYYESTTAPLLTRPVTGGHMLTLEDGTAWNPALTHTQFVREVDLAGNILRETNTGVLSQELLALGAVDAAACNQVPNPPPVGTACLNHFHHEALRLPNGYTAILGRLEKLFPPGTQGSTTGLPVDVIGDMAIVLNANWQPVWYFDEFEQLDINRAAPLGETCVNGVHSGPEECYTTLTLANSANDWTHTNSIYYISSSGDLLVSIRHQDWLIKIDYKNGTGQGGILWRMGNGGDFSFNNTIPNNPFPWFSHQHDAEYQSNGVMTLFDNGNTRVAPPPIGLGTGYSRGMALTVDETAMQVTPVLSVPLGYYAPALGSAALLSDGNYFFQPGIPGSYDIQILPTPDPATGTQVFNLSSSSFSYRGWQMPNLYEAPTN